MCSRHWQYICKNLNVGSSLTLQPTVYNSQLSKPVPLLVFPISNLIALPISPRTGALVAATEEPLPGVASGGAALASPGPGSGSGTPAGSGGKERSENLSPAAERIKLSLQGRRRASRSRQQALSMAPGAADAQPDLTTPATPDQLTQCLIQAPSNRPYFPLLQGYQDAQVAQPNLHRETYVPPFAEWATELQLPKFHGSR